MDMKRCGTCGVEKPASTEFFYRNSTSRDGLQRRCIACAAEYRAQHREELNEYARARYEATRDKRLAYMRQYYATHKEKVRAANLAWRKANPDRVRMHNARYVITHYEQVRAYTNEYNRRWRAKRRERAAEDPPQ